MFGKVNERVAYQAEALKLFNELCAVVVRANPAYELLAYRDLPVEEQALLRAYVRDPDFFGVLKNRLSNDRRVKVVCHNTARLCQLFRHPQPYPEELQSEIGRCGKPDVLRLLADGILEAEYDTGFASGPQLFASLLTYHRHDTPSCVQRLSLAALHHAQAWPVCTPFELSSQLYVYNCVPVGPDWTRMLANRRSLEHWLGIEGPGRVGKLLKRAWHQRSGNNPLSPWLTWDTASLYHARSTYKLYLSPILEDVPEVFAVAVELLVHLPHQAFKIGATLAGLCRPDKFVVYFEERDELDQAAEVLLRYLHGYRAQGVPFTAALHDTGLLSWGTDPPTNTSTLSDAHGTSWRVWMTKRLASALVTARQAQLSGIEPWQYALFRVGLDGVTTTTWTPATPIWHSPQRETTV